MNKSLVTVVRQHPKDKLDFYFDTGLQNTKLQVVCICNEVMKLLN